MSNNIKYEPKTWITGEVIDAKGLNNIEAGVQTQADWNQDDVKKIDYINNRPFYIEKTDDGEEIIHYLDDKFISENIARITDLDELGRSVFVSTTDPSLSEQEISPNAIWINPSDEVGVQPNPTRPKSATVFVIDSLADLNLSQYQAGDVLIIANTLT